MSLLRQLVPRKVTTTPSILQRLATTIHHHHSLHHHDVTQHTSLHLPRSSLTTAAAAVQRKVSDVYESGVSALNELTSTNDDDTSATTTSPTTTTSTIDPSLNPDNLEMQNSLRTTLESRFNITQLYPIQAEAYTPVVSGSDVIARSRTGTGKTLAFVLPIVERLLRENEMPQSGKCKVVIMEPTRELAKQVADEIHKLTRQITCVTIYGGAPYMQQESALRRGVDIVIATPGRLIDHINRGNLDLSETMTAVLDESDEMLRMGFVQPIEEILGECRSPKHVHSTVTLLL